MNTEVFYHGTYRIFDKFSLNFLGEGEGDNKFGKGTSASLRAVYVKEGATKSALGEISK